MLTEKKRSIVLLQGDMQESLFDELKAKKEKNIFVVEGRPSLSSSKKTCAHLLKRKMKPTLITDNMSGFLFFKDLIKEVWIAYQSIGQGGAFCSIGALILGVLGKKHNVPVHLFPAFETVPFIGKEGDIFRFFGKTIAPKDVQSYVPLVELLPAKYISEIH